MTPFLIPLANGPQTLSISLAGTLYNLRLYWNVPAQLWLLDIASASGTALLSGIPLVTGVDLLDQYQYLGFGGSLYAQTDNAALTPPTFDNLGVTGNLYFVTNP